MREEQAGNHDDGKDQQFRLDNAPQRGACQFDLTELDGGLTIIVDGNRGIPDFNTLVTEKTGPGNKARFPDEREADKLAGDASKASRKEMVARLALFKSGKPYVQPLVKKP